MKERNQHMAMESGPSMEEQKNTVRIGLDQVMEVGQTWYLLDYKWYTSWRDYVNYSSSASNNKAQNPGPIDNSRLFTSEGELREQINEGADYELVPANVWLLLVECYGLAEGQSAIDRGVIEFGSFSKVTRAELYPPQLLLAHYKDPTDGKATKCSLGMTVEELKYKMRKMYEVPEAAEVKLVSSYMSANYEDLENDEETLARCNLQPRQFVVIVEKEGANWPDPDKYKKASASNFVAPKPKSGAEGTSSNTSTSLSLIGTKGSSNQKKANGSTSNSNGFISSSSLGSSNGSGSSSSYSYSSNYCKTEPGLCGLNNLGNTCFMNSAIQCLSNAPKLTSFFTTEDWKSDLNINNPLGMHGKIAKRYAELMEAMWSGKHSSYAPRDFKRVVGDFAPRFSGYQQQDSHELMAFLLDGLHEDLNRIQKKPYVEIKSAEGRPDRVVAEEAWSNYKKRNDSVIIDLFHGQLKSTLRCPSCLEESVTFDPFCYLSLPIPGRNDRKLTVHYVPADYTKQPIKCRIKVASDGSFDDIFEAVAKLFGTSKEGMIGAEVYMKRFHRIYDSNSSIPYSTSDQIFIYQTNASSDRVPVAVYFKNKEGDTKYSKPTAVGWPMLISVPKVTTFNELYTILRTNCQRFVDIHDMRNYPSINHIADMNEEEKLDTEENGGEKGDIEENGGEKGDAAIEDAVEPMEVCTSPKMGADQQLFQVDYVTSYGGRVSDILPTEGPITLKDDTTLCVEFDSVTDTSRGFDAETHNSFLENEKLTVSLTDCLRLFTSDEKLSKDDTWYCPKCKDHVEAYKKFALWKLPDYLVIQLKRYRSSISSYSYSRDKLDVFVDYPVEDLDLSQWVIDDSDDKLRSHYDLIAVSNHYGGLGGGHYTAYAKNHRLNNWYYFDDTSVHSSTHSTPVNKNGYLLVYEKRETKHLTVN